MSNRSMNCNLCLKQKDCPKSRNIENYRFECSDFQEKLYCSECGKQLEEASSYSYPQYENEKVVGTVYHCNGCGRDEVVEERWARLSTVRRLYFHG